MKRRSTRRSLPTDTTALLGSTGDRFAAEHGVPVSEVRYSSFTYHDGRRWTVRTCWEIRRGDRWEEVQIPITAATAGGLAWEESQANRRS